MSEKPCHKHRIKIHRKITGQSHATKVLNKVSANQIQKCIARPSVLSPGLQIKIYIKFQTIQYKVSWPTRTRRSLPTVPPHSEAERILESWEQDKLPIIAATQQARTEDTSQGNKPRER